MGKKIFMGLFIALFVLVAGCGGKEAASIQGVSDLVGKSVGTVTPTVPPEKMKETITNYIGGEPNDVTFFNRYSDCVAAVLAGKVDGVLVPRFCVEYSVKRNSDLKMISAPPVKVNVVMAVRAEDEELKNNLDTAITALQENGTLKKLEDEWVTNLPADNEPAGAEIPKIEGARTLYVGVCGDYVPLDYIAADGRPAGYNVALLTEISKLENINLEFVSLESPARFAALDSKKIDLIFCNLEADTPALKAIKNKSWVATKPYFQSEVGCFLVRE